MPDEPPKENQQPPANPTIDAIQFWKAILPDSSFVERMVDKFINNENEKIHLHLKIIGIGFLAVIALIGLVSFKLFELNKTDEAITFVTQSLTFFAGMLAGMGLLRKPSN